jgi:prolipoprotein diacylglyceryl transferase
MIALHPVWNPIEGIEIGNFTIRFYSLMFVISFLLGWYVMKKIYEKDGIGEDKLDKIFLYSFIAILLGARLGHVIFYQSELFKEDPLSILLPISTKPSLHFTGFAGLASHGAAIAMIIAMFIYSKKVVNMPVLWTLDRVVLPVSLGAVFVRLGNFFNSEIVGKTTDHPFGIRFIQDAISKREAISITQIPDYHEAYHAIATDPSYTKVMDLVVAKHPAQLYEAVGYVFVFTFLMFMYWKTNAKEQQGKIFGWFLVVLWSIRFIVEFVKESQGGFEKYPMFQFLSTGQWLSIPFIIIGVYLIWYSLKSKKEVA